MPTPHELAEPRIFQKPRDAELRPAPAERRDQPAPPARDAYPAHLITGPAQDPPDVRPAWEYVAPQFHVRYDFEAQLRRMEAELAKRIAEDEPVIAALNAAAAASRAKAADLEAAVAGCKAAEPGKVSACLARELKRRGLVD